MKNKLNSLAIISGCILKDGRVFLVHKSKGGLRALILDGKNQNEFPLKNDFYFGVISEGDNIYLPGKGGIICRFSIPPKASVKDIEHSWKVWKVGSEYGDLTRIRKVGKNIYCCGHCGQVYKLDNDQWIRSDFGLRSLDADDLYDIGGTAPNDLYVVGLFGLLKYYNGKSWKKVKVSTRKHIITIRSATPKLVYAGGYNGLIMKGHALDWEIIGPKINGKHYLDNRVLKSAPYFVHGKGIDNVERNSVKPAYTGSEDLHFRRLDESAGKLWSIGEDHVLVFNKKKWTRIV